MPGATKVPSWSTNRCDATTEVKQALPPAPGAMAPRFATFSLGAVFTRELVRVLPHGAAVTYPNAAEPTAVVL